MLSEIQTLASGGPGQQFSYRRLRFGPGAPRATIQASLHADEVPAMLVAHKLRERLERLEAAGDLLGGVQLVPYANPLGLAQHLQGQHHGRFDLRDGINFNRAYPDLAPRVVDVLQGRLGDDEAANAALIRSALADSAAALLSSTPTQDLKHRLLAQAVASEIVLDLHCDSQAPMHLYGLTPQHAMAAELGALLGAEAILLATESGDMPFDEACSTPWLALRQRFPEHPIPLGCFAVTVELRGEADTRHDWAESDADAIVEFLRRRGLVAGTPAPLPPARCEPTPLAASEPITSPVAGVVVFRAEPGEQVAAGAPIADVICPDSGQVTTLRCQGAGRLYARIATRWATPGKRLAKIAGTTVVRSGKLLSA
ncbi:MAG: M14 family metallopeptidase [Rubrivivax sp.]|jgi:predicted deacylase|nr:M14 family metallopeptidase [Rubrivivax sp.]